jgi:Actinobacteria/chloroflexi VLRF1 release factor
VPQREVSVGVDRLERWLAGFTERHGDTRTTCSPDVVTLVGADGAQAWIDVPFPPLSEAGGNSADGLIRHAVRPRRIGVLLVRRSGYAAGVFEGTDLVASKVGSSYVQGTTKAGGWSQQRYARRRANQASAAFADAADAAVRVFAGQLLDALVAGGDREAVKAVLLDRRLAGLEPTGPWLSVKDPKLRILATMPEQFRAVRIRLDP